MKNFNIFKSALLFFLILCTLLAVSCTKTPTTDGKEPASPFENGAPASSQENQSPSAEKPTGPFEISLSDASGKAGEEISVSLNFKNNPSVAGYSVTVVYDPQVLTFVECENKVSGGFAISNSTVSGKVRVMCTVSGGNNLSQNGQTDILTFKINENAPAADTSLELLLADSADSVYTIEEDKSMPSVPCTLKGSTVTVSN